MIVAISILALTGMFILAEGLLRWRREGVSLLAGILAIGGVALVCACVAYQCSSGKEARFASSLRPTMQLDRHPPPLSPEVRPPTLKAPGQDRAWDSTIIA